ncbi:MAG: TPM domain-containing protein [Bdellovibrionota bacterium]
MIAKLRAFGLLAICLFALSALAAEFKVPALTGPVVDQAGILDGGTRAALDNGLRNLLARGGTQVNVLTVDSLGEIPIEQASIQVTDAWKLGTAKDDKGVLLLIAPKERALRIEVGQGLEGVLTDADSKRIISDTITPLFREGRYDDGVVMGIAEIMRRTNPELDPREILGRASTTTKGNLPVDVGMSKLIRYFLILMFILFIIRPRRRRRGFASGLMWGAATGWGASRGGFGGGGFGGGGGGWGGGGGGFSGGGASGNW